MTVDDAERVSVFGIIEIIQLFIMCYFRFVYFISCPKQRFEVLYSELHLGQSRPFTMNLFKEIFNR